METINAYAMIVVGIFAGLTLITKRMNEFPRWLTAPIAIVSSGMIMHGVHHLVAADTILGTVSDVMIWFGFFVMNISSIYIYIKNHQ